MSMNQRMVNDGQSAVKHVSTLDLCAEMRIVLQSNLFLFRKHLEIRTEEGSHSPGGYCVRRLLSPQTASRMATEGYRDLSHTITY